MGSYNRNVMKRDDKVLTASSDIGTFISSRFLEMQD